MKDNLRNENGESYKIMRFSSSVKSKIQKKKNSEILLNILYGINQNLFFVYI